MLIFTEKLDLENYYPCNSYFTFDRKESRERVKILVAENENLICQQNALEAENEEMQQKIIKMGAIIKGKQINLNQTEQEVEKLRTEFQEINHNKSLIERELHACQNDLANSQADVDQANQEIAKIIRESESRKKQIADLKTSMAELSDHYQTHLRQSALMTQREKELVEEITIKSSQFEGI